MKFRPFSLAIVSLPALFSAGCNSAPSQQTAAPVTPTLSAKAKAALAEADAAVKNAKANYTLWVPADTAYKKAQEAAKAGDSAAVLKETMIVMELNKLAAAQTNYSSTETK